MNFRIVTYVGMFGVIMGVASVLGGIRSGREGWFWVVICLGSAFLIARIAPGKYFLHGFLAGLFAGIAAPLIQAVFFDSYLSHNPEAVQAFKQLPPSMSPRVVVLFLAPVVGIVIGVGLGFLSWIAGKMFAPKREVGAVA